jgi:hypothetical protein
MQSLLEPIQPPVQLGSLLSNGPLLAQQCEELLPLALLEPRAQELRKVLVEMEDQVELQGLEEPVAESVHEDLPIGGHGHQNMGSLLVSISMDFESSVLSPLLHSLKLVWDAILFITYHFRTGILKPAGIHESLEICDELRVRREHNLSLHLNHFEHLLSSHFINSIDDLCHLDQGFVKKIW